MQLPVLPLLVVLAVAWVAGKVSERLGYPSVLGELLAGILIGPPILGLLEADPALNVIAELGIILMMFYVGMEIDPAELRKASGGGLLAAFGGFLTAFVAGYFLVVALGGTTYDGIFVGMAAGVTSLATKSRILVDLQLLDTRMGHVMMAGALVADTLALIIFAGAVGFADPAQAEGLAGPAVVLGKIVLFFGGAWLVGTYLFPRLGSWMQRLGSEASFTVLLIVAIACAEAAHVAGLHAIVGAFLAGLFLREKAIGRTLSQDTIVWVRRAAIGFLAPVFFVTAGFQIELEVIWTRPGFLFSVIAVAMIGKTFGTMLFYLPTKNGWREGLVIGTAMNGRGGVDIIIAQIGLGMGIIESDTFSVLVLMAIFATALVPLFLKWGTAWLRSRDELVRSIEARKGAVIIGAGPTNRIQGKLLAEVMPVTLVDTSADNCEAARKDGLYAVNGSALDDLVLSRAGTGSASFLLAQSGNREVDALAARQARSLFAVPEVHIVHDGRNPSAHEEALKHTDGKTAFGSTVRMEDWDFLVGRDQATLVPVAVGKDESLGEFLEDADRGSRLLPLCLRRGDEAYPANTSLELEGGDVLYVLESAFDVSADEPFVRLVDEAPVMDVEGETSVADLAGRIAERLARRLGVDGAPIEAQFADPELWSSTIVAPGVAIPHIRLDEGADIELVLVRSRAGITVVEGDEPLKACFALATPHSRSSDHIQVLAGIVRHVGDDGFMERWLAAAGPAGLRQLMTGEVDE